MLEASFPNDPDLISPYVLGSQNCISPAVTNTVSRSNAKRQTETHTLAFHLAQEQEILNYDNGVSL